MKNLTVLLFVLMFSGLNSQLISDYEYVTLPMEFNNFKKSKNFGLKPILIRKLELKKYVVLDDDKNLWPKGAVKDQCDILTAELIEDKSFLKNKIILEFKDCSNKVIFSQKATSMIKELEAGFQDALYKAVSKVPVSHPKKAIVVEPEIIKKGEMVEANNVISNQKPDVVVHKFTNGDNSLQKVQLDDKQFILVKENSSVPFATFRMTAKNDVYRVNLSTGELTIGYFENGNIIIEILEENGDYSKMILEKSN